MSATTTSVDVHVFYFDGVGLIDEFLQAGDGALERLRRFHKQSRRAFAFGHEHGYVVTLFDNVWARLNASEAGMPSLLLDFAGHVMQAAQDEGFTKYFGAIPRVITSTTQTIACWLAARASRATH